MVSRLLPALLLCVCLSAIAPTPARADPPIWRVRDADTEMVLFGSVHALPEGIEWRTPALEQALAEAELVVFEILTPKTETEEEAMFMPFLRYFLGDVPLSQTVSAETFARIQAAGEAQGFPIEALDQMRPWAAAMMLSMGAEEELGRLSELGVDTQIEQALPEGRRTEALDTDALMHSVLAALAATTDADGEAMLIEVLDALADMDEANALDLGIELSWASGDVAAILEEVQMMKTEAPQLYQVLLIDRNTAWMPALIRMMQTETRVVVIAGAAHMVGEDGIPALLSQAGYDVEGP